MSFHLSVFHQLLESNLVSSCGNAIQCQSRSFKNLLYIVHPPLLWTSNRSFSCYLPIMNYGWPAFFVHSCDMAIPLHLLFRTLFSAISCPVLARTSTLLTLSVYLMRNIRLSHRFSHAFSLFSMAVVKLHVSLPHSKIGITTAFSSRSFICTSISQSVNHPNGLSGHGCRLQ